MLIEINSKRKILFLLFSLIGVLGLTISWNLFTLITFSIILTIINNTAIGSEGRKLYLVKLLTVNLISDIALFTGSLLLYSITGTFSITDNISAIQNSIISGPFYSTISILFIIAVLGKSASFPFHFWLTSRERISETAENILLCISAFPVGIIIYLKLADLIFPSSKTILLVAGILNLLYGLFLAYNKSELRQKVKLLSISQTGMIYIFLSMQDFGGAVFILISIILGRMALLLSDKLIRKNEGINKIHYWIYFASICAFIGLPVFIQFYSNSLLVNNSILIRKYYFGFILQGIFVMTIFSVSFLVSQFLYNLNIKSFNKVSAPKIKDCFEMIPIIVLLTGSVILPYIFSNFGNIVIYNPLEKNGYIFIISLVINLFTVSLGVFFSFLYVHKSKIKERFQYQSFFKAEDFVDNIFAGLLIDKNQSLQTKDITFTGTIYRIFKFNTLSSYLGLSLLMIVIFYFIFRSM